MMMGKRSLKIEDFDVPNSMPNKLNIPKTNEKQDHEDPLVAEVDENGQTWVFPMCVHEDGKTIYFDTPQDAMEHNKMTGNAIQFKDLAEAEAFLKFKESYSDRQRPAG